MPMLTWCEEFDIHVKEIDEQHQRLLELVTHLHSLVEAQAEKARLKQLLMDLLEFTHEHFATEEELMRRHDYPRFAKHHKEHKLLLRYMKLVVEGVSQGKYPTFFADYDVSTDWAMVHIEEHDRDMGVFLNARNVF
jgi:hemerythrin